MPSIMKKTVRSFPRRRDFLRSALPRFLHAAPPSYLAGAQARSPTTRASATLPPAASTGHAGAPPLPPRARAREPRMPAIQHRRPSLSSSPAAGTSLPRQPERAPPCHRRPAQGVRELRRCRLGRARGRPDGRGLPSAPHRRPAPPSLGPSLRPSRPSPRGAGGSGPPRRGTGGSAPPRPSPTRRGQAPPLPA